MDGWLGKVCKGFSVSLFAAVDHTLEFFPPSFLKFLYVLSFFLMVWTHIYLDGFCKLVFIDLSHHAWRSPFMNNLQIKSQFQNLNSEQFQNFYWVKMAYDRAKEFLAKQSHQLPLQLFIMLLFLRYMSHLLTSFTLLIFIIFLYWIVTCSRRWHTTTTLWGKKFDL